MLEKLARLIPNQMRYQAALYPDVLICAVYLCRAPASRANKPRFFGLLDPRAVKSSRKCQRAPDCRFRVLFSVSFFSTDACVRSRCASCSETGISPPDVNRPGPDPVSNRYPQAP